MFCAENVLCGTVSPPTPSRRRRSHSRRRRRRSPPPTPAPPVAHADRQCRVGDIAEVINVSPGQSYDMIGQKGTVLYKPFLFSSYLCRGCGGSCFAVGEFRGRSGISFFCADNLLCGNVIGTEPTPPPTPAPPVAHADRQCRE